MRCPWAHLNEQMQHYHDTEWGRPCHDDCALFERLTLEAMQAGLSWNTILQKRANFNAAFDHFDLHAVAAYDDAKVTALLQDIGIIRHRKKIEATIANAQAILRVQQTHGSFDHYLWQYVSGTPIQNHWQTMEEVPATTPLAKALSRDLKKLGFQFVGPTTVYSFMQSIGMVNDHLVDCIAR